MNGCAHTQAHISTVPRKVTAGTLNLGHVRRMLAEALGFLLDGICTTFLIRCLGTGQGHKPSNHKLPQQLFLASFFPLLPPPLSFFQHKLRPICKCSLPQGQIGGVENSTIYPNVEGNEGTRHLAQARYKKFA